MSDQLGGVGPQDHPNDQPQNPGKRKVDEGHRHWRSEADPHITRGGEHFEDQETGHFTLVASVDGKYLVEADQEHQMANGGIVNPGVTINKAVGVRYGNSKMTFDVVSKVAQLNGTVLTGQGPWGDSDLKVELLASNRYKVASAEGDVVEIQGEGVWTTLIGTLGPDRCEGDVRGAFGIFTNADGDVTHLKRDGSKANSILELITNWLTTGDEELFPAA